MGFYTEATAAAEKLTDGDPGNYCAFPCHALGDSAGQAISVTRAAGRASQRHLRRHNIKFEECESLEFVGHGPLEVEASDWDSQKPRRDRTHALERDFCEAMARTGYRVLNKVDCLTPTDDDAWKPVRQAFAQRFDRLSTV